MKYLLSTIFPVLSIILLPHCIFSQAVKPEFSVLGGGNFNTGMKSHLSFYGNYTISGDIKIKPSENKRGMSQRVTFGYSRFRVSYYLPEISASEARSYFDDEKRALELSLLSSFPIKSNMQIGLGIGVTYYLFSEFSFESGVSVGDKPLVSGNESEANEQLNDNKNLVIPSVLLDYRIKVFTVLKRNGYAVFQTRFNLLDLYKDDIELEYEFYYNTYTRKVNPRLMTAQAGISIEI